jgi:hypothetical protein
MLSISVRRSIALAVLTGIAVLLLPASPAAAMPALHAETLPAGFPAAQQRFVAGTAGFKAAAWSTACRPGGPSAGPNSSSGVVNTAARAGGVDVGRYLEAVTPSLSLLEWWTQDDAERSAWWAQHLLVLPAAQHAGANAAQLSPPVGALPTPPAMYFGGVPQYPSGYCSAELAQWADRADTQTGFRWAAQLDAVTLATMKRGGAAASPVQKTPCDPSIAAGGWCSIAYYVDCTRATGPDQRAACTHWNQVMAEEIDEGYHWAQDHRSTWDKFTSYVSGMVHASAIGAGAFATDVADFFAGIYHFVNKLVDFIANASTAFDKFVNELKANAVGLITSVLRNYNHASAWDPSSGGFLHRYALMAGLGVVLSAFMFLGALRRAIDAGDRDELRRTLLRLVKTIGIILWAPTLFQILATTATKASADVISHWTGGAAGGAADKLQGINSVTDSIPGGAVMGFILFLLMFLGALGLWVGLMAQRYGMELGATLIAFVAGAYVHPRWKHKVSKAIWVVIGLILAKPVTMIVLGAAFRVINEGLSFGGSPSQVLAGLTLATIGILTTGLAPFAALKWAPVLPTGSGSHDHHRGAGAAGTGVLLGAAGAALASGAGGLRRGASAARTAPGRLSGAPAGGEQGPVGRGSPSVRGAAAGLTNPRLGQRVGRIGRAGGAAGLAGAGLGPQLAASGVVRGRALADHQTPDVDLPTEED